VSSSAMRERIKINFNKKSLRRLAVVSKNLDIFLIQCTINLITYIVCYALYSVNIIFKNKVATYTFKFNTGIGRVILDGFLKFVRKQVD
jgi:hypothetical protein